MKTRLSILTLGVVALIATVFTGCAGDDLSTPTIVINGDNPVNIELGGTWTPPTYTATDNEDGDLTADVQVDDSEVNTNEIGSYDVTYTVSDKAGNTAIETLTVNVTMGKTSYSGTYAVHEECDLDGDGNYGEAGEIFDYNVDISGGLGTNELLFDNFGAYEVVAVVTFDGDLNEILSCDYDLPGTGIHFSGDGVVTTGTTTSIEFNFDYQAEDGGDVVPCNAVYTKL